MSYVMKQGILFGDFWKVNRNWETTWSEFPNVEKAIVEQVLGQKKEKNPKQQDCESHYQGSK